MLNNTDNNLHTGALETLSWNLERDKLVDLDGEFQANPQQFGTLL